MIKNSVINDIIMNKSNIIITTTELFAKTILSTQLNLLQNHLNQQQQQQQQRYQHHSQELFSQ
jgi:hypothetical protein